MRTFFRAYSLCNAMKSAFHSLFSMKKASRAYAEQLSAKAGG